MTDRPFNVMFQQAAALRQDRQAIFRKKFDSYPIWYQHSYFNAEQLKEFHESDDYNALMKEGLRLKESGNNLIAKFTTTNNLNSTTNNVSWFYQLIILLAIIRNSGSNLDFTS